MRREHSIEEDKLIKFLQEHNCIFYSPLSQDDTTDWISDNEMVKYANGSAVWDSNLNMWKFKYVNGQPISNMSYYVKWSLKEAIQTNTLKEFTAIVEYYPYDSATWQSVLTDSVYDFLPYNNGMSFSGITGQLNNSAHIWTTENNSTHQKFYRNGEIIYDANYGSLQYFNYEDTVCIGNPRENRLTHSFGLRNFAVFGAPYLTISEINEYFNIVTA